MKVDILRKISWFGGNTFQPIYFDENVFKIKTNLLAGKSVPLHYHKHFDEHWTIEQGTPTFVVGKEKIIKQPGETFFCARNIVHGLRNDTKDDVHMITEMRPAADMAKMMAIIAGLQDEKEKAWMFKYFYVEKKAGLKEFSNPTGTGIKIMTAILMPVTMAVGKISGWDKFLTRYF